MPPKNEAPHRGGATCDKLAGGARFHSNLEVQRAQFLMTAHCIRPELAVMVAALAFGGAGQ